MTQNSGTSGEDGFPLALAELGAALHASLDGFEQALRKLHPPAIPTLRSALGPLRDRLDRALADFREVDAPAGLEPLSSGLAQSAQHAADAQRLFGEPSAPSEAIPRLLQAMRCHCRALEGLYPLRKVLPPLDRFLLEPDLHDRLDELDPEPVPGAQVGFFSASNDPESRGGFSLYVPESCDGSVPLPLVVALHGGSGHGSDFLWTWLREVRGRRCLLLAPTSTGPTWSFNGPDVDGPALRSMVRSVIERWKIDSNRVLLTGLSDGATYSLLCGLQEDSPFSALAPISGVLHPSNFSNGNLQRARGVPIYLVHGVLDWMFPIDLARAAHRELLKAGASVTFREIEDLSHTYPREENARILDWMGAPVLGA